MREQFIEYRDGEALLEGFRYDEAQPVASSGADLPRLGRRNVWNARRGASWQGYACFALDNYSKGKRGTTPVKQRAHDAAHE
jgi:hypothetical protein